MNEIDENTNQEKNTRHHGVWPFILVFGGLTVLMILIKLILNLVS